MSLSQDSTIRILCFSRDEQLLASRCEVLGRYYEVAGAASLPDVEACVAASPCDLLLVCHTLPSDECAQAEETVRRANPDVRVLAIADYLGRSNAGSLLGRVQASDGPQGLLQAIGAAFSLPARPPIPQQADSRNWASS